MGWSMLEDGKGMSFLSVCEAVDEACDSGCEVSVEDKAVCCSSGQCKSSNNYSMATPESHQVVLTRIFLRLSRSLFTRSCVPIGCGGSIVDSFGGRDRQIPRAIAATES